MTEDHDNHYWINFAKHVLDLCINTVITGFALDHVTPLIMFYSVLSHSKYNSGCRHVCAVLPSVCEWIKTCFRDFFHKDLLSQNNGRFCPVYTRPSRIDITSRCQKMPDWQKKYRVKPSKQSCINMKMPVLPLSAEPEWQLTKWGSGSLSKTEI